MSAIERYQMLLDAAVTSVESDPRAVGRWLLGLAILIEAAAQDVPRVVSLPRPWAHALVDEGALLSATRTRMAHQLRILAGESMHVRRVEHRRDFYARIRELIESTRDPSNAACWIGLTPEEPELLAAS